MGDKEMRGRTTDKGKAQLWASCDLHRHHALVVLLWFFSFFCASRPFLPRLSPSFPPCLPSKPAISLRDLTGSTFLSRWHCIDPLLQHLVTPLIQNTMSSPTPTEEADKVAPAHEVIDTIDATEASKEARFYPPLWQQRRNLARRILDKEHATSVRFFFFLLHDRSRDQNKRLDF